MPEYEKPLYDVVYFDCDPDDGDTIHEYESDWCLSAAEGRKMGEATSCLFFIVFRLAKPFGKRVGIEYVSPMNINVGLS